MFLPHTRPIRPRGHFHPPFHPKCTVKEKGKAGGFPVITHKTLTRRTNWYILSRSHKQLNFLVWLSYLGFCWTNNDIILAMSAHSVYMYVFCLAGLPMSHGIDDFSDLGCAPFFSIRLFAILGTDHAQKCAPSHYTTNVPEQ